MRHSATGTRGGTRGENNMSAWRLQCLYQGGGWGRTWSRPKTHGGQATRLMNDHT